LPACSSFFFTAAAARLDRSGRRLVFAGAGHPPCMLIKPGAEPQLLEAQSMPFEEMLPGILEGITAWRRGPFEDDVTMVLAEVVE